MSVKFAGQFSQRIMTKNFILFVIVFLVLLPFLNTIAAGRVVNSAGNAEQWMNLTNALFDGDYSFTFSYGPLYWLVGGVTEYYNAWSYFLSMAFILFFYSFVIYSILILTHRAKGYLQLLVIVICFFSLYYLRVFLFIWPLLFLVYRQSFVEKNFYINARVCLILGVISGFLLYIRFFYGITSVAVISGYIITQGYKKISKKELFCIKEISAFILAFAVSSIVFGMLIYGNIDSVVHYIVVNMELSYGNGVDMTLGIENYFFAYVCAFIVLACFVAYGIRKRLLFLLPLVFTWLLLFKLGFGRADHYITYFVIPCAFIMLLISYEKGNFTKALFLVSFFSLYYLGTHSSYDNSPKLDLAFSNINIPNLSNPFDFPFPSDIAYKERMAKIYSQYKLDEDFVKLINSDSVDIYPYNNEYMFANHLNYKPRPLFQNYMTLTPVLDQYNADYYNSSEKPKKIIWNSGIACADADCNSFTGLDNKYILNEDPLTSTAILENYTPAGFARGKNSEPILLLTQRDTVRPANFILKKVENMKFGVWYSLPEAKGSIVKIFPNFKVTTVGNVKNILFRGDVIKIRYKLKSGLEKEYRLNIINSQNGVWASPLLDGLNANGFTGEDVVEVMFETDSNYYLEPEFDAQIFATETPLISYQRRKVIATQPVTLPSTHSTAEIDCEGSIDEIIPPVSDDELLVPMALKGWLAKSTGQGTLFDSIYIVVTDKSHHKLYFLTKQTNRLDLIKVFGQQSLENAGYEIKADTSGLHGDYTVSLSGRTGDQIFVCRNLQRPLTLK